MVLTNTFIMLGLVGVAFAFGFAFSFTFGVAFGVTFGVTFGAAFGVTFRHRVLLIDFAC